MPEYEKVKKMSRVAIERELRDRRNMLDSERRKRAEAEMLLEKVRAVFKDLLGDTFEVRHDCDD